MLSVFHFEFRKISGMRFLLFLVALLLVAATVVCFFSVRDQSPYQYGNDAKKVIEEAICSFQSDPSSFERFEAAFRAASFEKTQAVYAEWEEKKEESGLGDAYPPIDLVGQKDLFYTYVNGSSVPDAVIEAEYLKIIAGKEDFERLISGILGSAKQNAERLKDERGAGLGDPLYYYQVYVYRTYEEVQKNTSINIEPIYGWETLFSFTYGDIFLFAALLLFASVIFPPERSTGMLPLLRASKYGRMRTSIAKAGTLFAGSAVLTLLFCASAFFTVFCTEGYSDPFVSAQNIPSLRLFPEAWSVLGYFIYALFMKLLAGAAFSFAVAFVSALTYQTASSFAAGLLLFGGSFALSFVNAPVLRCFNFVSLAAVTPYAVKLQVFQSFFGCIPYLAAAPVLCLLAVITLSALTVLASSGIRKSGSRKRLPSLKTKLFAFTNRIRTKFRSRRRKIYRMSLLAFEARKQFFWKPFVLLFAVLMTALQITVSAVQFKQSEAPRSYRVYTAFLLPETEGSFAKNGGRFEELLSLFKEPDKGLATLRDSYKKGSIDKEEHDRLKEELTIVRDGALAGEFLYAEQLNEYYSARAKEGKDPTIMDFRAFSLFFESPNCFPLYGLILFVCALSFVMEYNGKNKNDRFANILRAAKNGRRKTFAAKFVFSVLFSLIAALLFYGVQSILFLRDADFSKLQAPLCSLPQFGAAKASLTVGKYLLFFLVMRVVAAVLFALFVTALSQLTKNLLFCLAVSSGLTLIPTAFSALGLKGAGFVSFGGFFSATEMAKLSMEQSLFSTNFGAFMLFGCSFALLTAILTLYAGKSFVE